jgi:hypothetical protein
MKYRFLLILLSAACLSSCNMASRINQSTYEIQRNTAAIDNSTYIIYRNNDAISRNNAAISRNLVQLKKVSESD